MGSRYGHFTYCLSYLHYAPKYHEKKESYQMGGAYTSYKCDIVPFSSLSFCTHNSYG